MDMGLVSGLLGAQQGQIQMAVAAKMLKMNAGLEASAAQLLHSAQQNVSSLADVAAGIGGNLDMSV